MLLSCCLIRPFPQPMGPHHYHGYVQSETYILICSVYTKENWKQWLSETHLTFGRTASFLFQGCRLFNLQVLKNTSEPM